MNDEVSSGKRWSRRRALTAVGGVVAPAGCLPESKPGRTTDTMTQSKPMDDSESWPQFGDIARNSRSASSAGGQESSASIDWRFDAGTPTMNSSPVVADGRIFVGASDGLLRAIGEK